MWTKKPLYWTDDRYQYYSIVFTWHLPIVRGQILERTFDGKPVIVGGTAVKLMPDYLSDIANIGDDIPWMLQKHNPQATRTTVGCIRKCKFCAVPVVEPEYEELSDWEPAPIVCDNNLLACSMIHFHKVIDKLKQIKGVDFNQGLDARLLQRWHIDRLKELDISVIRFAWDNVNQERSVENRIRRLVKSGFPKSKIRVYVLVGYGETQDEAWYRMKALKRMGIKASPMRYQPLDALHKNRFRPKQWDVRYLNKFIRYWSFERNTAIPFDEWDSNKRYSKIQLPLGLET